jgi:hypothetical protein
LATYGGLAGRLAGKYPGENSENVTGIKKFVRNRVDPRYLTERPYSFGVAERELCPNLFLPLRVTSRLLQEKMFDPLAHNLSIK